MRLLSGLLFFAGLSAMWLGSSVLLFGNPQATSAIECKATCGFLLLASSWFGPAGAPLAVGGFTFLAGLALALLGRSRYEG